MKSYDELKALIDQRGVHAVFGAYGGGWGIEQNADELAQFLVVCQQLDVQSVLEIGTGWRAGLARFLHDDMGWSVTSVDIHDYGHQYDGVTFITGLDSVAGYFDLVLLDGDHSYEGVERDYSVWTLHATKVVAFHDIAGLRDCEGVKRFWNEISHTADEKVTRSGEYKVTDFDVHLKSGFHEIIASGDQRGGIGYVVLGEVEAAPETPTKPAAAAKASPAVKKPAAKKPTARASTTKKPAAKKAVAKK